MPVDHDPWAAIAHMPLRQEVLVPGAEPFRVTRARGRPLAPEGGIAYREDRVTDLRNGGAEGLLVYVAATDIEQILIAIHPTAITHPFEPRVRPQSVQTEEQTTLQHARVEHLPRPDRPKGVGEPHPELGLF